MITASEVSKKPGAVHGEHRGIDSVRVPEPSKHRHGRKIGSQLPLDRLRPMLRGEIKAILEMLQIRVDLRPPQQDR